MSRIKYVLRDSGRLIWRHLGISFLTIFTAMAVFYIVGASMLFIINIKHAVDKMDDKLSIQAYIKDDAVAASADQKIATIEKITSHKIITKEEALERLRARLGNQSSAVTLLGSNPLPSSIEIIVSDAKDVKDVVSALSEINEIEDIVYAGTVAEKLSRISGFVEKMSLVILIIALTVSGLVLFNSIKIAVYSRAEEINVMMKVGATSTYVAFPFVIQGFVLGLLGAVLATLGLGYSYYKAITYIKDMLPFIEFVESLHYMLKLGLVLISCGAFVSLVASLIAVEKFIRSATKPL